MTPPLYAIVGAGGFGREVMPVAAEMLGARGGGTAFELVFVDDHPKSSTVNSHRVMTPSDFLAHNGEKRFNIAIADYRIREKIANDLIAAGASPFSVRASNNICMSENVIGEGAILCPFTTITSNATVGRFFHANIYSYVAHDCRIGDFVTFAPSVHCNGRVTIEDYAYVGTGAVLKQGTDERPIVIGKGAVIGMGAVVTKSVAPYTTVVGNPAAPLVRRDKSPDRSDANS